MKTLTLALLLFAAPAFGAQPPTPPQPQPEAPRTLRELELEKALVDTQMELLSDRFRRFQERSKELADEIARKKPPEKTK